MALQNHVHYLIRVFLFLCFLAYSFIGTPGMLEVASTQGNMNAVAETLGTGKAIMSDYYSNRHITRVFHSDLYTKRPVGWVRHTTTTEYLTPPTGGESQCAATTGLT